MWLVTIIYWFQLFLAPVIILGLSGLFIGNNTLLYIFLIVGVIAGIVPAGYTRRMFGLDVFFGRIYGPNSMDEIFKNKEADGSK